MKSKEKSQIEVICLGTKRSSIAIILLFTILIRVIIIHITIKLKVEMF